MSWWGSLEVQSFSIILSLCWHAVGHLPTARGGPKIYNDQVNDEPGNYGAGFLGLRRGREAMALLYGCRCRPR